MKTDTDTMRSARRHFLAQGAMSLAPLAMSWAMQRDGLQAAPVKPELARQSFDLLPKHPRKTPQATAMISMFMQGGPSQVDLMDPKPELNRLDGKQFPGTIKYDNAAQASSRVLGSPWKFRQHGECGTPLSELLPGLSQVVDDILVIRSMHTGVNNHGQSIHAMNTGRTQRGRPALGSWLTFGLGADTDELPAYVAMTDPRGLPVEGVLNWSNGWLPSLFQGTVVRPREPRILNLEPPERLRGRVQLNYLDLLTRLNQRHLSQAARANWNSRRRIANFRLAARMQTAAREALDISRESKATHTLYGLDDKATVEFGTRCLIARRLVERGVRFVQLFTKNQYWDHHGSIRQSLPASCLKVDRPAAALVADLKQRGLLDSTVVHWGGEMGRSARDPERRRTEAGGPRPQHLRLQHVGGRRRFPRGRDVRRNRRVRSPRGRKRGQPLRLPRHAAAPLRHPIPTTWSISGTAAISHCSMDSRARSSRDCWPVDVAT